MNKKFIIKIIKMGMLAVSFFAFVCLAYVFVVVHEVDLKLEEMKIVKNSMNKQISKIEEGTILNRNSFNNFLIYTNIQNSTDKFLKDLIDSKTLVISRSNYLVEKAFETEGFLGNDCKRYRCIQYRVDFEKIPSSLWKGLMGIEDYRFLEHDGVDIVSIFRAFVADLKAMKLVQGGSTLTMQLAKNLFLYNDKKLERKVREMIYAFYIEYKIPKEEILTTYFNEVFWGVVDGVYIKGVKAASLTYFGKQPFELSDYESAMLIGFLKGPYYYNPFNHLERLKERTKVVYDRLQSLSLVSDRESSVWNEKDWIEWSKRINEKNTNSFVHSVYLTSKSNDVFFEPYEKFVFYESVKSTQRALKESTKGLDIGIKFIAMDSSCESFDCDKIFSFYSKFERNLNTAIFEEKHQVGSVLKPIIYEQFMYFGKSLDDYVSTKPITLDLVSGKWTPKDASLVHEDEVQLSYAIKKSKNIPLIRIAKEIGFDKLEPRLLEYFPHLLTPLKEYPAQLLGSIELSLGELGIAYLKYFKKTCQSIKAGTYTFEKSILYELSKANETTISNVSSSLIKNILMFGKTGTTNKGLDNWYIAFDGKTFYAIWFGVDSDRTDKVLRLAGATSAFKIFQNFQIMRGKQFYELYCHE